MTVYVCEDSFEGILSGIYDAVQGQEAQEDIRLELEGIRNMELFCVYKPAAVSEEKVKRVLEEVRRKLSEVIYEKLYLASLSQEEGKADGIYRFLMDAFHYGNTVLQMHHRSSVQYLLRLCQFVEHESHQLTGFVRFAQTGEGVLFSRIGPKSDVLPLLAVHFADRLPSENWMIYDEHRGRAAVHPAGRAWFILREESILQEENGGWSEQIKQKTDGEEYASLWKTFHQAIAIAERENPVCQRTLLPMRYRAYMTEFLGQ